MMEPTLQEMYDAIMRSDSTFRDAISIFREYRNTPHVRNFQISKMYLLITMGSASIVAPFRGIDFDDLGKRLEANIR